LDRFIQQALLQVLQSRWDVTFSEHSYGFRPGRSAHQAIAKAQAYLKLGYGVVVDGDLEAFFDRVNHDRLMSRLAQRIGDKRVLKLIRSYLQAGIMENGLVKVPTEGTPQGGPLSPFFRMWCWTSGTRDWRGANIDSCAMVMTAISTSRASVPENVSWPVSDASSPGG